MGGVIFGVYHAELLPFRFLEMISAARLEKFGYIIVPMPTRFKNLKLEP
jgi:hypothetical protein